MSGGSLYQGKEGRNLLYVREIRDIDLIFYGEVYCLALFAQERYLSILRFIMPGRLYSIQVCCKGGVLYIEKLLILGEFFNAI